MPPLAELNRCDRSEFAAALGHLFEHSPWVAEETWERRPFRDERQLHTELCARMHAAPFNQQMDLLNAHPDLAGRFALAGKLTADSAREQASAGLDRLSAEELARFQRLNTAYRARFGFPFIICARLNARSAILTAMEQRLGNPPETEFAIALGEIEKIAWLRLQEVLGRE